MIRTFSYVNAIEERIDGTLEIVVRSYLIRFDSRLRRALIIDEFKSIDDTFVCYFTPNNDSHNGRLFCAHYFCALISEVALNLFMNRCENILRKIEIVSIECSA